MAKKASKPVADDRESIGAARAAVMDKKMQERAKNEQKRLDSREVLSAKTRPNRQRASDREDAKRRGDNNDVQFDDDRTSEPFREQKIDPHKVRIPEHWKTLGTPAAKSLAVIISGKPVTSREEAEKIIKAEVGRRGKSGSDKVTGRPYNNQEDIEEVENENLMGDGRPTENQGLRARTVPKSRADRGHNNPTANEGTEAWEVDLEEESQGDQRPTRNEGVESWEKGEDEERDVNPDSNPSTLEDDESNLKGKAPDNAKHVESAEVGAGKASKAQQKKQRRERLQEKKKKATRKTRK